MREIDVGELLKFLSVRERNKFVFEGYKLIERIISTEKVFLYFLETVVADVKSLEFGERS